MPRYARTCTDTHASTRTREHAHTRTYYDSIHLHREDSIARNHIHAQTGRGGLGWGKSESILLADVASFQSCAIDLDKPMRAGARRHCYVQDCRNRRAYGHGRQPSYSCSHCTQVRHPHRGARGVSKLHHDRHRFQRKGTPPSVRPLHEDSIADSVDSGTILLTQLHCYLSRLMLELCLLQ